MSLRDRLQGRQPRTVTVQLPRGDVEQLRGAVLLAAADRTTAAADGKPTDLYDEALQDAQAALRAAVDVVELQAMLPAAFEALQAAHTEPDGELDVTGMRPHLLAACCTDESVQDPDWWAAQAKSGAFTAGDLTTLWLAAYRINATPGSVGAPKG